MHPLCDKTFPDKLFNEKMTALNALEAWLVSRKESSSGGRVSAPGLCLPCEGAPTGFPGCIASRLVQMARTDPFPRIRTAAVRLLVRCGPPAAGGASVQDYLPGLIDSDAISACAVLQFLLDHFGASAFLPVLVAMRQEGKKIPDPVLRILRGAMSGDPNGVDSPFSLLRITEAAEMCEPNQGRGREHTCASRATAGARERFKRVRSVRTADGVGGVAGTVCPQS